MHGLKTIVELNNLAAQNAPGAAEAELAKAEAVHKARTGLSDFDVAYQEQIQRQKEARQRTIETLLNLSNQELIDLAKGINGYPSTLETALATRLEDVCSAFGILSTTK